MYQRQYQRIQPQTTAHLAQTMTLLNMNLDDLRTEIDRALNDNPALVIEERWYCPTCHRRLAQNQVCPVCSKPNSNSSDEVIVFLSQNSDFYTGRGTQEDDLFNDNVLGSEELTLEEYVLQQISLELNAEDKNIAAYILNQLDDDGLFRESTESLSSYFHVSLDKVESILRVIQRADPVGVGSNSPMQAIKVQLEVISETGNVPETYIDIAEMHLEELLKKQFKRLSELTNLSENKLKEISEFFSDNLNPYPSRSHWGTFRQPGIEGANRFTTPDVVLRYINNDESMPLIVEILTPSYGNLTVNPLYQDAIKNAGSETKDKLKEDLNRANLFIKCIQQRNNTMLRLMQVLVELQKDFIRLGEKHITPITRVQISKELDVHESTISRAVSNKLVQLPSRKIIPMAKFFDRSLGIRADLKEIIAEEEKTKPFSDAELVKRLKKRGHKLARRTVAKYRSLEGILPAYQRRISKD